MTAGAWRLALRDPDWGGLWYSLWYRADPPTRARCHPDRPAFARQKCRRCHTREVVKVDG